MNSVLPLSALAWFRLLLVLLVTIPAAGQAQFTYITNNGTITITGYTGSGGGVTVPEILNGLPVVKIGDYAFYHKDVSSVTLGNNVTSIGQYAFRESGITNISIPSSVTNLGEGVFYDCFELRSAAISAGITTVPNNAFYYCAALTSATIPEGITSIENGAFAQCYALRSVTIPNTVTNIGYRAFASTGLTNISLGDGLTSIADEAFQGCYLPRVIIPQNVTSIGLGSFPNCGSFEVSDLNWTYSSRDGVLFNKSQTTLLLYPRGKGGHYLVPDTVQKIGERAFAVCLNLTNIDIPPSVTAIGAMSFMLCRNLRSLTIPDSITRIGPYAFQECESLTSLVIPGSVMQWELAQVIGGGGMYPDFESEAFYGCIGVTNIVLEDGVTSIPPSCFSGCTALRSIRIPASVTSIGGYAFQECSRLAAIQIPNSVIEIGAMAFGSCHSLTAVRIPDSVTTFGPGVFSYCTSLEDVTLGNGIVSLDGWLELDPEFGGVYGGVFEGCTNLTSIDIPNSVNIIGFGAFKFTALTNVIIPSSISRIERDAFAYCADLGELYCEGNAPSVDPNAFYMSSTTIYYLPGTTGWEPTFADRPTALWLPSVGTDPSTFSIHNNQFGFTIKWASGMTTVVETCTNAVSPTWSPFATNTVSTDGTVQFTDPEWTNYPARFYRVRWP